MLTLFFSIYDLMLLLTG